MRRAVITGAGAVSAFGVGLQSLFDGLAEGRAAVREIRSFDASTFPVRVAGEVPLTSIDAHWLAREMGTVPGADAIADDVAQTGALRDRKVAFALLAAAEAWRAAGSPATGPKARLSFAVGLEQAFFEDLAPLWTGRSVDWSREPEAPLPAVRFRSPVDLGPRLVARLLGLRPPLVIHSSACAAGALAVAHAATLIERGEADLVLCGGADSMVNPLGIGGFARIGAPSPRNEPDACRPFDRHRDGLAIGEGAAAFVIEEESRARSRGARVRARVLGWGSTQDGYRATAPRPDGAAARRAMERALRRAGVDPGRVGYVNAHGTGTPLNDPAESLAIRGALGTHGATVPVSSIKGAVGHLMSASGAIELAACLLAFERGLLPGTAHHRERDPDCPIDVIGERPRRASVEVVLSNSFGFGGQNVTVALGNPEAAS
jgi:3-oxoacyl-[acyl-carrier-protein] synthase II